MIRERSQFGTLLRTYRLAAHLTQEELAETAGVSTRAISDLERGNRRSPYRSTVLQLAEGLRLSTADAERLAASARVCTGQFASTDHALPWPWLRDSPPLVGRAAELTLIDRHLAHPRGPLLILAGEPGIGKSRLLFEAGRMAATMGMAVLYGSCRRRSGQEPYAPLLEALAGHIGTLTESELRRALQGCGWLERLLPELAGIRQEPLPSLPLEQERRLMFGAVITFLENLAGPGGILLLLDDLQWSGGDFLNLLSAIVASRRPPRIMAAYRSTETNRASALSAMLSDLARDNLACHHDLQSLSSDDARPLVQNLLLAHRQELPGAADRIVQRAGGVPLFLIGCAEALAEREESDVPWNVRQSVQQRVAELPMEVQVVLATAAIIGRVVSVRLLRDVTPLSEHALAAALDTASRARLLVEDGPTLYRFAHDLIREVVEADLGAAQTAQLHTLVGEALERGVGTSPPEDLAHHFGKSEAPSRALPYQLEAADRARGRGAHHEAAELLAGAIELAVRFRPESVPLLRADRGLALCKAARFTEARYELEAAIDELPPQDLVRRVEALVALAIACHWLHDTQHVRAYALAALTAVAHEDSADLAAAALCAMGFAHTSAGELMESLQCFSRASALAGESNVEGLLPGLELSGLVHYWLGHSAPAVECSNAALTRAREVKDTMTAARALANLGLSLASQGRYREALEVADEARALARELHMGAWLARSTSIASGIHLEVFDYAGAEALAEEARALGRAASFHGAVVSAGIDLLLSFARSGKVGAADLLLNEVVEAVANAQGWHEWQWTMRLAQARAEIALARGDWNTSTYWAGKSLKMAEMRKRPKYQVLALETRGRALVFMNGERRAAEALHRAVTIARSTGDPILLLRPLLASLSLDTDENPEEEARAIIERIEKQLPPALQAPFKSATAFVAVLAALPPTSARYPR